MCGEGEAAAVALNGWYILLWVGLLIASIFSRSLIVNMALIFGCILGYSLALELADVNDVIRYGLVVMFLCVVGFAIFQIFYKVKRL
jgi:hypothetical protein